MAATRELTEEEKLRLLVMESDLLRASMDTQISAVRTPAFWVEQGMSVVAWALGPQHRLGQILTMATGFFGSFSR